MEFLPISWQQLHKNVFTLSQQISAAEKKHHLIVAIARGGLTIAQILSDFLSLPVATFTISSYKELKQNKLSDISYHLGGDIKNKHILLVDDVSDSGKTFERGILYLHDLGVSSVTTASVFTKPHTVYVPNFFVSQTSCWIVFPYEVKETVESVVKVMKKENKTKEEIKNKLKAIKIPNQYIKTYLK